MRRFAQSVTLWTASTVAWASTNTPKNSASKWNFAKCDKFVELKHDPKLFERLKPDPLSVGEKMLLTCPLIDAGTSDQEILDIKVSSAEKVLKAAFGPASFSHLTFKNNAIKLHGVDYSKLTPKQIMLQGKVEAKSELLEAVLHGLRRAARQKRAGLKGGPNLKEPDIDRMTTVWLELSGFGANGLEITGADKRRFTFRGKRNVTAIPDSLVVETKTGDLVLIVENKAGRFVKKDGYLGQLFAMMLCCLWNNIQGKSHAPSKKLRIYGIRMLNHHASFHRLDSNVQQVQQVCDLKPDKFLGNYKKMVLRSHTAKPNQTTKQAREAMVKDVDFLGMSLADPVQRKHAQKILSKVRKAVL